jgi:hypothetical protein
MEEMDVLRNEKRLTMLITSYTNWQFVGFKLRPILYSGLARFMVGLTSKNFSR